MKSLILLLIAVIFFSAVNAEEFDFSWNKPEVRSLVNYSWLQETSEDFKGANTAKSDFALSSINRAWESVKNYFRYHDDSEFFNYSSSKKTGFSLSLLAGTDALVSDEKPAVFQYYGISTRGWLGKNLYFYSQMWSGHYNIAVRRNSESGILIDSWTKTPDDKTYLDNARGKLLYRTDLLDIALGRGKYEIGSNIGGSVILNDDCNEYGYFNIDLKLGNISFSVLNASLVSDSTAIIGGEGYSDFEYSLDKYMAIHKVDYRGERFHGFLGESVIYGARAAELSYLLPVTLIRVTEHNLGDFDNVLIFGGLDYKWNKSNKFYFNIVLDELRKSEIFSDWWGNKYAVQAGNSFEFGYSFLKRIVLEATLVRPWLYTHDAMLTKYSHDQSSLGFSEGSNLMQIAAEINLEADERLHFDLHFAFIRQGETGSDWNTNYEAEIEDIDNYETAMFSGNPANRIKAEMTASWKILAHHKLKLSFYNEFNEKEDKQGIYISWFTSY